MHELVLERVEFESGLEREEEKRRKYFRKLVMPICIQKPPVAPHFLEDKFNFTRLSPRISIISICTLHNALHKSALP